MMYEPTPDGRIRTMSARSIRRIVRVTASRRWALVPSDEATTAELMRPTGLAVQPGEDVPGTVRSIDERGGILPSEVDERQARAADRPWTDATKLGHRSLDGGYRFLGTATVVASDGTTWTQLAPSATLSKRGHDGTWKLRTTKDGKLLGGHAGQAHPAKRHATPTDAKRAYRQRRKEQLAEIREQRAKLAAQQADERAKRDRIKFERTNEWQ